MEFSEVVQRHRMDRHYSSRPLAPEANGQAIAGGAVTACDARGCAARQSRYKTKLEGALPCEKPPPRLISNQGSLCKLTDQAKVPVTLVSCTATRWLKTQTKEIILVWDRNIPSTAASFDIMEDSLG